MSITTSNGERYDSLENFIGQSPSEYIDIFKTPSRLDNSKRMKQNIENYRDLPSDNPEEITTPGTRVPDLEGLNREVYVSENLIPQKGSPEATRPGRVIGEGGGGISSGKVETIDRAALQYQGKTYTGNKADLHFMLREQLPEDINIKDLKEGFVTSEGRFLSRKASETLARKQGQIEETSTKGLVSDDLPDVMKARESDPRFKYHYKFIDSPPDKKKEPSVSLEDTEHKDAMDAYVRSADFPNFMMTKSSDLENVKSSENIESRSSSDLNYVTVAKDVLKTAILSQPSLKEGGVLREDIGIKDLNKEIQKGIDRTKLRKFGRGVLDEEGEARFRRDFPDVAEDVIKMYRKSKRGM